MKLQTAPDLPKNSADCLRRAGWLYHDYALLSPSLFWFSVITVWVTGGHPHFCFVCRGRYDSALRCREIPYKLQPQGLLFYLSMETALEKANTERGGGGESRALCSQSLAAIYNARLAMTAA